MPNPDSSGNVCPHCGIPGLESLPEKQYLEAVDEGLELILDGVRARLGEVHDDDGSDRD